MCDREHATCINALQVEACLDKETGADCVAGDIVGGCFGGVCFTRGCGNRIIEPGVEQCDDGNVVDDDDCSSDCRSNKRCGNGVVDVDRGEQCEDGNLLSRDGCDSRCQTEAVTWSVLPLSPSIPGGGTYDPVRDRLVILVRDHLWELAEGRWSIVAGSDVNVPDVRSNETVFWNPVREQIVAVHSGGTDDPNIYDLSLRAWDGVQWTTISEVRRMPFATRADGAAYDTARGRTIVLAGTTSWAISSTGAWTQLGGGFSYAIYNEMANDPQTGVFLMMSGNGDQAFELTGSTWTAVGYPGPNTYAMTAAETRLRALDLQTGQMWIRQGGAWVARPSENYRPISPGVSSGIVAALYFDTKRAALAVSTGTETSYFIDGAWETHHVPSAASQLVATGDSFHLVAPPDERSTASMLAWRVDSDRVSVVDLPGAPSARNGMTCVNVPGRASTLCQGGYQYVGTAIEGREEAFLVDGAGWRPLALTGFPGPGPLAYDPEGRRVVHVSFGGTATLDDTATEWVLTSTGLQPPSLATLAWDGRSRRMVGTVNRDSGLYELDADGWRIVPFAPNLPLFALANERRGTVHMFDVGNSRSATWQRTGNTWTEDVAPPMGSIFGAAYSPATGEVALLMYAAGGVVLATRRFESGTPLETCGPTDDADTDGLVGCADPDCYGACGSCPPFASCMP